MLVVERGINVSSGIMTPSCLVKSSRFSGEGDCFELHEVDASLAKTVNHIKY